MGSKCLIVCLHETQTVRRQNTFTAYTLAPTAITSFDVSLYILVISLNTTCAILFSKLQFSEKSVLTDTVSGIVIITCPFRCAAGSTALLAKRIIL